VLDVGQATTPARVFGLPVRARWSFGETRPELSAVLALESEPQLAALLGAGGDRGRYSVVGVPSVTRPLDSAVQLVPPGRGLAVVFAGYELGAELVHLRAQAPPRGQPLGLAFELETALVVDHARGEAFIIGEGGRRAVQLERAARTALSPHACAIRLEPLVSDAVHGARIEAVRAHIAAGDIYQANVTRRVAVHGALRGPSAAVRLALANPVAHGAFVRAGDFCLVSNSMETLLTYDAATRRAESFPIKGTHRRQGTPGERGDDALVGDAKERAEHVMIVDLVRNDLGRVAVPGSVEVPALMAVEGYQSVWHGVSTVRATLAAHHSPDELTRALFPGGSITGAPKRRAIEILRQLEGEPRGAYTGSLGLVLPDGSMSWSILIRTLVHDDAGWSLGVGGGIVEDSTPERELAETWTKVDVFRRVLS
jgi:anthranilate/para-aminobenzoate synthase component I